MVRLWGCAAGAAALWAHVAVAQVPPPQMLAKADTTKGQQIAKEACAACHAADGNSVAAANPKIAGQIPEYLHKQLSDFKARDGRKAERDNPIMAGMVASLSGEDMRSLAAFYGAQKLKPAAARNKDLAALGQRLYRGGIAASGVPACAGCHGPTGAGMPAQYPRIAGQFSEYLEAQLKAFRAGTRANDPNGMMRGVVVRMNDREIQAVAEYVSGLR